MNEYYTLSDVKSNNQNIRVKFITRNEENNKFLVFKSFNEFLKQKNNYISLHEIIFSEKPRKFFVDLDAKGIDVAICDEHKNIILSIIKSLFAKNYNKLVDDSNIVVVDSTGESKGQHKYSINLIVNGYYFHDYAEFKWFGDQVVDAYYSIPNAITSFLDTNFFHRGYVDSNISARLPNCTKVGEARYKTITSNHTFVNGVISYVTDCFKLPLKSNIDREAYVEKAKKFKEIDVNDIEIKDIISRTQHLWQNAFSIRCFNRQGDKIVIEFDRNKPSECYFCKEIHHNDNSLILTKYNGCIFESCRQAKGSRCIYSDEYIQPTPRQIEKVRIPDSAELEYDKMFPPDKNIYFIRAEMKMGKTKKCIEYLNNNTHEKIIMISFRRTFSSEMKSKYVGFELYSDIKESSIDLNVHNKVIIQVESLHRLDKHELNVDLVILDEIESIWSQFSSGNISDYYGIINIFTYLLRSTKKLIVMDANLDKRTQRLVKYLRPDYDNEVNYYINRHNPCQDYKYYLVQKSVLQALIYEKLNKGKRIAIMTNSLVETMNIKEYIDTRIKKKIMVYNSKTRQSKKNKHFANVNKYWKKYDCIICSPTVSAGISFEEEHFDYVFGIFTSISCNVETCRQMLGRVRNVRKKTMFINIAASKRPQDEYPTNPDIICQHLKYHREKLIKNSKGYNIELLNFEITENGNSDYYDTFAYRLVSENIAFDNKSRNDFTRRFCYYLTRVGSVYTYIHDSEQFDISKEDIEETRAIANKSKQEIVKFRCKKIVESESITNDQYVELKQKISMSQDVTKKEQFAMDKFKITNIIGIEPDVNLAELFIKKKNLLRFNMTKSLFNNLEHTSADINNMNYNIRNGHILADASARYSSVPNLMVRKLIDKLTNFSLVDLFTIGTNYFICNNDNYDIGYLRKSLTRLLNSLNRPIPRNIDEFDKNDIFVGLSCIMNDIYWLQVNDNRCFTRLGVAFKYNDKLYSVGKEIQSNKLPIILIKGD